MIDYFAKVTGSVGHLSFTPTTGTDSVSRITSKGGKGSGTTITSLAPRSALGKTKTTVSSSLASVDSAARSMEESVSTYSNKTSVIIRRYGIK